MVEAAPVAAPQAVKALKLGDMKRVQFGDENINK
jgi:hypothetical protein